MVLIPHCSRTGLRHRKYVEPHALGCSVCSAKTVVSCRPQSNALSELKTYQWFWLKPQWTMIWQWYFDDISMCELAMLGGFERDRIWKDPCKLWFIMFISGSCCACSSWRLEPHARNMFLLGDWKQSVFADEKPTLFANVNPQSVCNIHRRC